MVVIIPTFNCEDTIEKCLSALAKQNYRGTYTVLVIDGGSTDRTLEIAKKYTNSIFVNHGQYSDGLGGAKDFGRRISDSNLLWFVDSDNYVLGDSVLSQLVEALISDDKISISLPFTAIDPHANYLNNWISMREIYYLNKVIQNSEPSQSFYIVSDLSYGLTNCTLIKRESLDCVGGYDSDVRTLSRLRRHGLSRAAIVPNAAFYHNQVSQISIFIKKWVKRAKKFSSLSNSELKDYFVEFPFPPVQEKELKAGILSNVLGSLYISIVNFCIYREKLWLIGVLYSFLILAIALRHPLISYNLWRRFL